MSEQTQDNNPLIEKLQKYMKITLMVMLIALIFGGVGGWLVYDNHGGGSIYGIELLLPVIIASIVAGVGLRIYRGKLFASKDEFKQASELFKQKMEAKNNKA